MHTSWWKNAPKCLSRARSAVGVTVSTGTSFAGFHQDVRVAYWKGFTLELLTFGLKAIVSWAHCSLPSPPKLKKNKKNNDFTFVSSVQKTFRLINPLTLGCLALLHVPHSFWLTLLIVSRNSVPWYCQDVTNLCVRQGQTKPRSPFPQV